MLSKKSGEKKTGDHRTCTGDRVAQHPLKIFKVVFETKPSFWITIPLPNPKLVGEHFDAQPWVS